MSKPLPQCSSFIVAAQLDNILLHDDPATCERPIIKLADWGFSKNEALSCCDTSCGTPEYIAPELSISHRRRSDLR